MSKAFTKEPEAGDVYEDLPDRPVSSHNLVTARGLELIEAELVIGLCDRWHQPPSVIRAESAEVLRLLQVIRLGTPASAEGGEW